MPAITVYGFDTSNNMKVRVALGFKGIDYDFRTIDPRDRDEVVRLSGQQLTPVMVHGDRVLFDSAAILRYLDANFAEGPRLFGATRDQQWQIEDWELFARCELAGPMMAVVHRRVSGEPVDAAMVERCTAQFHDATAKLVTGMQGREWLVGDQLSAADITAAAVIYRIRAAGLFPLPANADALAPWIDRVMSFDRLR